MKTKPNPYRVATEKLSALLIRYCVVFALLLSGASAGIAQISSPVVEPGEWSGTSLTAARWRNFRAANSGWDIAVGKGIGTSATTWANKDFGNLYSFIPGKNIFSYSYNASTGAQTVSADVNGGLQSSTQNLGNLNAFNLQISIKAETGKRVEYKNVVLTAGGVDYPLPDFTAMGETKNWKIRFDLSGGFTIKGDAFFDNASCQECSRIDLFLKSVPPPGPSPVVEAGEWSGSSLSTARWRNFRAANTGWDIAVGKGIGTSATTWANKDFGNLYSFIPGKNVFSYSYNASTGAQTVSADVNGGLQSATQNLGNLSAFNLQISIKAETGKRVEYRNVVLTSGGVDYPLPDFTAMGETKNWKIRFDLSGGFTIKGDAYFDNTACQECSRIDLYLKSVPPASSTKSPLQDVPKDLEGALSVYPNPTLTGQVSFRVSMEGLRQNLGTQSATVEVFDQMGSPRLLRVVTLDNTGRGSLDASSLPRGTYTLQVKVAGMTYTTRLKRE